MTEAMMMLIMTMTTTTSSLSTTATTYEWEPIFGEREKVVQVANERRHYDRRHNVMKVGGLHSVGLTIDPVVNQLSR